MTGLRSTRVQPIPGVGIVHRRNTSLLVILGDPDSPDVAAVLDAVGDGGDDGRVVARRVAAALVARPTPDLPPFCLISESGSRLVVMVQGSMAVFQDGRPLFLGEDSPTWVDGYIDELANIAVLPAGTEPAGSGGPWNLEAGTIAGSGALVGYPVAVSPAPSGEADGDEPPTSDQAPIADDDPESALRFELIDLAEAPADSRPPLPTGDDVGDDRVEVSGVRCSRGHFNHPNALYCAACGIKMVHVTRKSVLGPRPPVGLLVVDDGTTYALDTGYVIGREPQLDERVRAGAARPLATGEAGTMSRVHAEIRLEDWDVVLVDLGSTNGTYVRSGEQGWERLTPQHPFRLDPGMEVSLGDRRIVFESNVIPKP